jgi:hypothetical protein
MQDLRDKTAKYKKYINEFLLYAWPFNLYTHVIKEGR